MRFMFGNFFTKIVPFMRLCGKIWYSQGGHRWKYNRPHALCMLDNWGYRHTLPICNTYCFSTVTMVTRTHLNDTLCVHCLPCTYLCRYCCNIILQPLKRSWTPNEGNSEGRKTHDRPMLGSWIFTSVFPLSIRMSFLIQRALRPPVDLLNF